MQNIRLNILKIRYQLDMNQAKFGALFGVTPSAVHHWEAGLNYPPLCVVYKLSNMTGYKIDEIVKRPLRQLKTT